MDDIAELRARHQNALDDMLDTSALVSQKIELLDAKQANWDKLTRQMEENTKHAATKIKLDVGGKIFCIGKTHLLSVQGSYFHAMLATDRWKPDGDGAYFIDRNPKHFDRILDFLRTGELSYAGMRPDQIETLKKTLDYLQLGTEYSNLQRDPAPVTWDPQMCGSGLRLSQGNRVVVCSSSAWQAVLSLNPCVRYSVRIDSDQEISNIMIGFSPQAGFTPDSYTYTTCGWYFYAHSGSLFAQGGANAKSYAGRRIESGSIVTCILDRERNSINFEVDGVSYGVAFTNIPQGDIYAAVNVYTANIQLTLVN